MIDAADNPNGVMSNQPKLGNLFGFWLGFFGQSL
jgi:hypothetical protein